MTAKRIHAPTILIAHPFEALIEGAPRESLAVHPTPARETARRLSPCRGRWEPAAHSRIQREQRNLTHLHQHVS